MHPLLRAMRDTDDELRGVDELLTLAYGTASRRRELELYQTAQPDGWYVIEDDGRVLAVAGCISYGSFCWLGLVATHPEARGRGLAKRVSQRLVEWAAARGCRTIALDASGEGRPVYERLGFRAVGETAELVRPAGAAPPDADTAERASADELPAIAAFDRDRFGADRSLLLGELARDPRARWFVTRDGDRLSGYLLRRDGLVGPGAAIDARAAGSLVRSAIDGSLEQRVLVPAESAFHGTLAALGFGERRRLTHMRRGELELPGARRQLLAQLSYATG